MSVTEICYCVCYQLLLKICPKVSVHTCVHIIPSVARNERNASQKRNQTQNKKQEQNICSKKSSYVKKLELTDCCACFIYKSRLIPALHKRSNYLPCWQDSRHVHRMKKSCPIWVCSEKSLTRAECGGNLYSREFMLLLHWNCVIIESRLWICYWKYFY